MVTLALLGLIFAIFLAVGTYGYRRGWRGW